MHGAVCPVMPAGKTIDSSVAPYSLVISYGSRSPFRGLLAVCWWVRDNPAPQARARAQVAALATRGTDVVNLYLSSSDYFRCKACSFPEYFTPKSSTTKVNFIGRLLCFHIPGGFLEGWYTYGCRCFTRASWDIFAAWGSPYIPFVTCMNMYSLCDFSMKLYLSTDSCGIIEI